MRTCFSMDPLTVDPRKNGDLITSTFLSLIYDGLTRVMPNGDTELALAESYVISEDQKTYTFRLRDAYWSDGHPLTAYDFEYAWKKSIDPKFSALSPQLFYPILNAEAASRGELSIHETGIRALNPRTLEIRLAHPTAYFLSLVSFINFYPIPKHIEEKNPLWENDSASNVICCGPFKITSWKKKREIVCERNPLYWDAANVLLDAIQISIVSNPYAVLHMFDNDDLDLVSVALCSLPLEKLDSYCQAGILKSFPVAGSAFCSFNVQRFPFCNPHIRKAFSCAIDREALVREVSLFGEIPAERCIPSTLSPFGEAPLLPCYDEDLARQHLNEGFKELGKDDLALRLLLSNLSLTFVTSLLNRKIAEQLQAQWKKILGFNVRLESYDYNSYIQKINQGNYAIGLASWLAQYNDPMNFFERFKNRSLPKNLPKYENPEFTELLNLSSREANPEQRKRILAQAEQLFLDDLPLTPIYHHHHAFLLKPHLSGLRINAVGGFYFNRAISSAPVKAAQKIS